MKNNFAKRRTFAISSIVSEIGVRRKLNVWIIAKHTVPRVDSY
jgi:hypothetical protein